MTFSHKMFMIVCLASTAFAVPAMAQEEEVPAAVQAFLDNIERQTSVEPTYDSVAESDDGVTLKNLTLSKAAEGEEPAITLKIAEATFSEISEEGEALYRVGSATFDNMTVDVTGKDFSFNLALPESSAEGWYIHEVGDNPTPQKAMLATSSLAKKMSAGKMTFTSMGQTFTVDGIETNWDGDPKTGSGKFNMRVSNIAIPEAALAMVDQGGMLKQLGYTSLSFDILSDGETVAKGENMDYAFNVGLTGRDIATIRVGLSAGDVPIAVFAELQKAQSAGKEPDFNALMPQIQNISISGASLKLEDHSITKKILPMVAAMQGMDEKTLVASVGPMLQMGLMQLQNEAFAQQAMSAVTSFLNDPKSLTIKAAPAAPLKVSEFMAMDPNAPGAAITKLGVSVSAND
jgi:hypothetical protein